MALFHNPLDKSAELSYKEAMVILFESKIGVRKSHRNRQPNTQIPSKCQNSRPDSVTAVTVLVSIAMGFTLLFAVLQSIKDLMTREGFRYLTIEYIILTGYGWIIGVTIFMRYLKRAKILRKLLD